MSTDDVATDANGSGAPASIRPPDLAPDEVRGNEDVLAGWDTDVDVADLARWQVDRAPFPTDAVVVVGAKVAGALIGAAVDQRRGRGFVVGAMAGLAAGVVTRRLWRLDV
ncbi:hypothetical protein [Egicoccus sp. AB-alg6-2]|uniref:hypothetical protein n=1 Tax=Egicoccus sp. AB-alg6-2 TaxID=3242692 RepID=UPI00359EDFE6